MKPLQGNMQKDHSSQKVKQRLHMLLYIKYSTHVVSLGDFTFNVNVTYKQVLDMCIPHENEFPTVTVKTTSTATCI